MSAKPNKAEPPKEIIAPRHESLRQEFGSDLDDGPGYAETRLWIVARDARSIFAYWELDAAEHPEARDQNGVARFFLRVLRGDGSVESTVEIAPDAHDWNVPVSRADADYSAELGFYSRGGVWCFLARSGTTRTPPELELGFSRPGTSQPAMDSKRPIDSWTTAHERALMRMLARETAAKCGN